MNPAQPVGAVWRLWQHRRWRWAGKNDHGIRYFDTRSEAEHWAGAR